MSTCETTQRTVGADQNLAKTTAGINDSQTTGKELRRLASQMQTMDSPQCRVADSTGGNNPFLS